VTARRTGKPYGTITVSNDAVQFRIIARWNSGPHGDCFWPLAIDDAIDLWSAAHSATTAAGRPRCVDDPRTRSQRRPDSGVPGALAVPMALVVGVAF
jgi:hypothetical protein